MNDQILVEDGSSVAAKPQKPLMNEEWVKNLGPLLVSNVDSRIKCQHEIKSISCSSFNIINLLLLLLLVNSLYDANNFY